VPSELLEFSSLAAVLSGPSGNEIADRLRSLVEPAIEAL
jgi:hypothetical protein